MSVDTLPPGESAADELSAGDALDAIHAALQAATLPASHHLVIGDVDFQKVGRIVLMSLSWREGKVSHAVTVRMSAAKARSLVARLAAVVGE